MWVRVLSVFDQRRSAMVRNHPLLECSSILPNIGESLPSSLDTWWKIFHRFNCRFKTIRLWVVRWWQFMANVMMLTKVLKFLTELRSSVTPENFRETVILELPKVSNGWCLEWSEPMNHWIATIGLQASDSVYLFEQVSGNWLERQVALSVNKRLDRLTWQKSLTFITWLHELFYVIVDWLPEIQLLSCFTSFDYSWVRLV